MANNNNIIVAAVTALLTEAPQLKANLHRDRDWIWVSGNFKEEEEIRKALKAAGFRFSKRVHDAEGSECQWFFSPKVATARKAKAKKAKAKVAPVAAVKAKKKKAPSNFLDRFTSLFGDTTEA